MKIIVVAALATLPIAISSGSIPPWAWRVEERLAARYDPDRASERSRKYAIRHALPQSTSGILIDGQANPELFLPHELFDALLVPLTAPEPVSGNVRAEFAEGIAAMGMDEAEFWKRLATLAEPYIAARKAKEDSSTKSSPQSAEALLCAARHRALASARRHWGETTFDRLLYTVVAPEMQHAEASDVDQREILKGRERGCQ